jgi:sigma-B regulation protein RsbU (phosphoserine phosphatase)
MEKLMHIFGFQMACIQLKNKNYLSMKYVSWTEDRHKHFLLASQEYFNQPENTHRISPEEGASAMVFLNNHHYYFEDVQPIKHLPMAPKDKKGIELAEKFHPGGLRSILIIPLVEQNLPIGILQMWALDTPVKLSDTDIAIIKKFCSFISTTIKNSQLYQQIQEKNTIIARRNHQFKEELKLAKRIQKSLIPSQPPAIPDVNFATFYKPMEEVGGDFFDFIKVREPNLLGIFISDVSGHGVPAALITSMIKTFLETAGGNRLSPSSLLSYLNENILGKLSDHFLTAFYGLYNCETKKLLYARGAHNYPLLIRKGEIIPLESKGKILGLMNDVTFEEKEIQLLAGDKILFYTDGLLDAISPDGEEFGDYIPELLLQNCHKPVNDFIEILYHSMLTFCEAYHFEDDVCMIGMEMV